MKLGLGNRALLKHRRRKGGGGGGGGGGAEGAIAPPLLYVWGLSPLTFIIEYESLNIAAYVHVTRVSWRQSERW